MDKINKFVFSSEESLKEKQTKYGDFLKKKKKLILTSGKMLKASFRNISQLK
jgi:hypothetical protein